MSLSHTKVPDWQSLYKVGAAVLPHAPYPRVCWTCAKCCVCARLCVRQCTTWVHQGHGATPAPVHSTLSRHQRRVLWRPPPHRLPHQPSCETRAQNDTHLQNLRKSPSFFLASSSTFFCSVCFDLEHVGGFWNQHGREPLHHQSERGPRRSMRVSASDAGLYNKWKRPDQKSLMCW